MDLLWFSGSCSLQSGEEGEKKAEMGLGQVRRVPWPKPTAPARTLESIFILPLVPYTMCGTVDYAVYLFDDAEKKRYCYVRVPLLRKAEADPRILDALLDQLEMPGKSLAPQKAWP